MGIFSRKSKTSESEKNEFGNKHSNIDHKNSSDRNSYPDRPFDPRKLPDGPDSGFVYYED